MQFINGYSSWTQPNLPIRIFAQINIETHVRLFCELRYWKRNINDLLIIITQINLFEAFAQSLKLLIFLSVNYTHFRFDLLHNLTLHFKSDFM